MRRYTPFFFFALLFVVVSLVGASLLAGADKKPDSRVMRTITGYTTLPAENAAIIADAYENAHHIRVNFVPLDSRALEGRLKAEYAKDNAPVKSEAAVILADSSFLKKAAALGYVAPYVSEVNDAVSDGFKNPDGYWTGVWYDPIVFAVNADYLKTAPYIPDNWTALAEDNTARLGITDFIAAEASANLLYSMIAQFGDKAAYNIWRGIHPNVVQYAKYLSNPVRQAGMGEVDIAVAVESETLRYMENGYPIKIVYPADGTSYLLTGVSVAANLDGEDEAAARHFADWLLSDDAQIALQRNGFYFVPTHPATIAYKTFGGKNIVLFNADNDFTPEEKHDFLDRWMKYIRFQ